MKFRSYFSALAAFLLFVAAAGTARAQTPTSSEAPIVREISVEYAGPASVSRERILANMRTAVGKPYSEQAVEEDIRNLYATGNITNVRIFGEPVKDGVKVVVVVQTKATVGEVVLNGITQLRPAAVRKELSVKPGDALNEANLEQDRQKIVDSYEKKGYTDTDVKYAVDMDAQTNKARVTFTVTEGGKTSVRAVHFEGNASFPTKQLKKVIKTSPKNLLSFLTKAGRLQNEQLDEDVHSLKEFYQNHGYIDAEVLPPQIDTSARGNVTVTFKIVEGIQYHVGNVTVTGASVFTTDEVRNRVKLAPGKIFSPKGVQDDSKAIQDLYGARGYIDLQVLPVTASAGPAAVDVTYKLDEGVQSYIERINIQGNTRTKDKVIRRELAISPGDVYDTVRVDASKQRLQNLNYFSKIDTFPTDTTIAGRRDLNVLVEEKRTGSFNFGAGFSSIDSVLGFVELQQSNFDIMNWPNFTGGGQRFRARVNYGTERKDIVVSLTEPWFLDYQLSVGGEAFYREAQYVSDYYSQRDYGFDLSVRKSLTSFTSVSLDYRIEDLSVFGVSSDVSDQLASELVDRVKSSVTAGITNDTRDSVFLTRHGHRIDLSAYIAGGFLGGNDNIYGFDATGSQYFHLPWDGIFLVNGEAAVLNSWAGGGIIPIYDRLFLGGANNLRGFKYRNVGPKDTNGEPLGGNTLGRLTLEYTFPIIERVRGATFYDIGFVDAQSFKFSGGDVNSDVGVGLRIDLPIGPVRLDYGIPVQFDQYNKSTGKFNFNIGYQF